MSDEKYITMYVELEDLFGDYGLIGVIILEKIDNEKKLFITEWLMSCRVLKRGVEEFIVNKIVTIAKQIGYKKIVGEYIETPKNKMVSTLYSDFGFDKVTEGLYEINVDEYDNKKTFVEEIK